MVFLKQKCLCLPEISFCFGGAAYLEREPADWVVNDGVSLINGLPRLRALRLELGYHFSRVVTVFSIAHGLLWFGLVGLVW